MPLENEGTVTPDVDTVATETTPTQETTEAKPDASAAPAPARSGTENAIPHWRVEEMRKKDAQRHQAELAELRKQLEQVGGVVTKVNEGFTAFGRGLGFIKDEQPKYVDEKTYQQQMESLKREMSEQYEQKLAYRELMSAWKQVSTKHNKWIQVPGFKEACLNEYGATGRDLDEIADEMAGKYAKFFAVQKAEETAAKEADAAKTKIVKPGGGAGAPAPKGEKGKIADRVMARLKDRSA